MESRTKPTQYKIMFHCPTTVPKSATTILRQTSLGACGCRNWLYAALIGNYGPLSISSVLDNSRLLKISTNMRRVVHTGDVFWHRVWKFRETFVMDCIWTCHAIHWNYIWAIGLNIPIFDLTVPEETCYSLSKRDKYKNLRQPKYIF